MIAMASPALPTPSVSKRPNPLLAGFHVNWRTLLLIAAMFASVGSAAVAGRVGSVLPFTRTALTIVSAVLIARGLLIFAPQMWRPDLSPGFKFWSSAIVLVMGLLFAAGTVQAWHPLGAKVEQV